MSGYNLKTAADDLAWDWVNEKLYFTDLHAKDLEVYDPRSGYRRVLFSGLGESYGIIVDPGTRYILWCSKLLTSRCLWYILILCVVLTY